MVVSYFYTLLRIRARGLSIIPKPQRLTVGEGSFMLDKHTPVIAPADPRSQEIAAFLRDAIRQQNGIALLDTKQSARAIELRIDPAITGEEAYRLVATPARIRIDAASHKGLFWGVQTLRQLLPPEGAPKVAIPAVRIDDAPQFSYRGQMFDVGRHFFPVGFLKQQIDLLSYYKINTFRWHLTEDQGWRIEIRKYPKLTSVGAWRTEADGSRYGGFYTQEQIRDLVEYSRLRNITVIPEIEMPGHATAALASYPELSCRKQPIDVPATWGVFKDVYCVGDEFTFTFLQNVLDEVIALFPAAYVHIGGDEAPKDRWRESASSLRRMRDEGLKDASALQSYFVRRIQRYLAGKGKTLIGWDEILEGGADKTAIIEVWRGDVEGRKALENGNRIISAGPFYFDTPPDTLTLEKVYATDIVTDPVYAAHREQVLGAEAPLWTENITTLNAEAMLYPRLQAFAENLWSDGTRDFPDFQRRLQPHYRMMDARQIGYGAEDRTIVDYRIAFDAAQGVWQLHARRGLEKLRIHYTLDGSEPTPASASFTDGVQVDRSGVVKVAPFAGQRQYQSSRTFTLARHAAVGRPIDYASPISERYRQAGDLALADGIIGSGNFRDGVWVGWQGVDLDANIDLQQATAIHGISINLYQESLSWIVLPTQVKFYTSDDGVDWTALQTIDTRADAMQRGPLVRTVEFKPVRPVRARWVRVVASNYGKLPAGHDAAGAAAWIFADEITVQ